MDPEDFAGIETSRVTSGLTPSLVGSGRALPSSLERVIAPRGRSPPRLLFDERADRLRGSADAHSSLVSTSRLRR